MTKIVVLLDDAPFARQQLALHRTQESFGPSSQWVLVACAPRMTHRVSKWVSHGAREHWRTKWAGKLFGELESWLDEHVPDAERVLARGPLPDLLDSLRPDRVIDVRRPKASAWEAVAAGQPATLGSLALAWLGLYALAEA